MIGALTGKIKDAGKGVLLVETEGGVGYIVATSVTTKNTAIKDGTCSLFTHTAIRGTAIELYGFIAQEEYTAFLLLIQVSGIGPKKALTILETVPVPALLRAIKREDMETLVSFGIGKKQAMQIILTLQRKIETAAEDTAYNGDIVAALIALGYEKNEITDALKTMGTDGTVEEQIQRALGMMRTPSVKLHTKTEGGGNVV